MVDTQSSVYYSYITSLLKKDDFESNILQQVTAKELEIWPRFETYNIFINNIVSAGSKAPFRSIRTIYLLISDSIMNNQKKEQNEFYELFFYFIFADSIARLLPLTDIINSESIDDDCSRFFEELRNTCNDIIKIETRNKEILYRLVKQCSVVLFYCYHDSDVAKIGLENTLKDVNAFVLYRFIVPPIDYIKMILNSKEFRNDSFHNNVKYECIISSLLQLDEYKDDDKKELDKNQDFSKLYSKHFDIRALCESRRKITDFDTIKAFLKEKSNTKSFNLRGFLYLLRKPEFRPLNEICEYYEMDDNEFLFKEKDELALYNNEDFVDLFFNENHIKEAFIGFKDDGKEGILLPTKIILNLLARNPIPNIKRFCEHLKKESKSEIKVTAPFFRALTIVFDKKSGILDDNSFNDNQLDDLKAIVLDKYTNFKINIAEDPSYCKTVTVQECHSLSPLLNAKPQISEYGFNQRLEKAQSLTTGIITAKNDEINEFFAVKKGKIQFDFWNISNRKIEIQNIIYVITILFHTIKSMDINTSLFVPLVKMALHDQKLQNVEDSKAIQYFSLYAIQVFYIKSEESRFAILSAINQVMEEQTLGKKNAFTLLNLLNHLFKLANISFNPKKKKEAEWFINWSNDIQAILLVHLTSSYAQVRDMTLLVMERLSEILSDNKESLDEIFPEHKKSSNIISLLHKYDKIMMQKISQRLQVTCNSTNNFKNLNFSYIMRSSNYLLSLYALIEYAQVLSRKSVDEVIKKFCNIKFYETINKSAITNDINSMQIRYIVFAHRISPMFNESKKWIDENLDNFPESISLKSYEILKNAFSIDKNDPCYGMIDYFTKLFDGKLIDSYCKKLSDANELENFNILAALANSLSIELFPNFIKHFTSYLDKVRKSRLGSVQIIRLSIIIRCIVLSSDFNIFVFNHENVVNQIYQQFINWFLQIYPTLENYEQVKFEFLLCFFLCIISFSESPVQFRKKVDSHWAIADRQNCFKFLLPLLDSDKPKMPTRAILALTSSLPIFNDEYTINDEIYQSLINLEIKNPNERALSSILIQHPDLFDDFFTRSVNLSTQNGFYYFRAITEYFNFIFRDYIQHDIRDEDAKKVVQNSGKLILSSLVFIGTAHDECRKNAYSLLKCILPIICAFQNKDNVENAGIINNYLNQHQKELSIYKIAPTNRQVFELAKCIADNIPFIVANVFETFFSLIIPPEKQNESTSTHKDGDDNNNSPNDSTDKSQMSPIYFSLLLNAVSPFAEHLIFSQGSPVYPSCFNAHENKNAIDFVNKLIDIHAHLSKSDIPFYVKILPEACHYHNNIRTLAQILVMNANSQNIKTKPEILTVTSTLLLYLIQNVDPAEFLSLLVQRLSFGFWFTNKFGSTELLSDNPYNLLDWLDLSLNVLYEVACQDFSRLLPYIHQIIHYCLIYNNPDDDNANSRLSSLLNIIIKKLDVDVSIKSITNNLGKILPSSISNWKHDAFLWATSCGDLILAGKSASIYSKLEIDYKGNIQLELESKYKDITAILKSFYLIFREFEINFSSDETLKDKIANHLFYYLNGMLKMLISNLTFSHDVELNNEWKKVLDKILNISIVVLSTSHINKEPPYLALKIIDIILKININALNNYYEEPKEISKAYDEDSNETTNEECDKYKEAIIKYYTEANDYYENLSKLIANSFNQPRVVQIFSKIILESTETKFKIISLGHLLIFYYATLSAYHSINPYAMFINDYFLLFLNSIATQIKESNFDKYKKIFGKFFDQEGKFVEKKKPIDFINEITKEMWETDYIANIVKFYNRIIYSSYLFKQIAEEEGQFINLSTIIRDIVYIISKSFIDTCPEGKRNQIPVIFNDIIPYAIYDNTESSKDLINAHSNAYSEEIDIDLDLGVYKVPTPIKLPTIPTSKDFISDSFDFITRSIIYGIFYDPVKQSTIDFRKTELNKILMISTLFDNHTENQIPDLFGSIFQPFEEQAAFWNKVKQDNFPNANKTLPDKIESFDVFAHTKASIENQKSTDELYADKDLFDLTSFILRNDEFGSYEKRIRDQKA